MGNMKRLNVILWILKLDKSIAVICAFVRLNENYSLCLFVTVHMEFCVKHLDKIEKNTAIFSEPYSLI